MPETTRIDARRRHGRRADNWAAVLVLVAIVSCCACASSASSPSASSASRTSTSEPASPPSPSPAASNSSTPVCPNPEGGACLGQLSANNRYITQVFTPQLTYRVPAPGWSNYEDTPGNFLLVPPKNDLAGVNAGTSDFLGVYTAITPSRIAQRDGCVTEPIASAGSSPKVMAAWFQRQAGLVATRPVPVRTGGFEGVVVDLRTKPGAKLNYCILDGQRIFLAGLFSGVSPSSLDHAVIPGMTMRLFLLSSGGKVLGIELDDIDKSPGDLAQLSSVARALGFAS